MSKNQKRNAKQNNFRNNKFRGNAREERGRDEFFDKEGKNDISWYANNPALLRDVSSFPYGWPIGNQVNWLSGTDVASVFNSTSDASKWWLNHDAVPGVMSINYIPTIGPADSPTSPINLAADQIYTFVRHVNSGKTNYQKTDLMIYLLAMDQIYAWWSELRRVYGTMMMYSKTNRYLPRAIVKAEGFDFDDMMNNMAQLRAHINQLAVRMGAFAVPSSMSYMARHQWMCENIYVDSNTEKAQCYLYVPKAYYQFGYDGSLKLGKLTYHYKPSDMTYKDIVKFSDDLMNAVSFDSDMSIMSGDILKAFGTDGICKVFATDPNYLTPLVYNPEVLSQIQNSTSFGDVLTPTQAYFDGTNEVVQVISDLTTDTYLKSKIFVNDANYPKTLFVAGKLGSENRFITSSQPSPGPEHTVVATRLTNIVTDYEPVKETNDHKYPVIGTVASEYVIGYSLYVLGKGATGPYNILVTNFTSYLTQTGKSLKDAANVFNTLAMISQFDYHPCVNVWLNDTTDGDDMYISRPTIDLDNYAILGSKDLSQMSSMIMQSMFAVPIFGAWNQRV